ncbi:MAG TPA: hypothetical protein VK968_20320 [Roseimicrobium sp.]|nr:hypothetical protein [Roseimicrobium sp.]
MKHPIIMITVAATAAMLAGCQEKSEPVAPSPAEPVKPSMEEVTKVVTDYSYAQKQQFVEKMKVQLTDLNAELDKLAATIDKAGDAVKAEAQPKLQALREQSALLNKRLDEVTGANESTWDSVKEGFKKAHESSKESFTQFRQWLSDKIAP